MRPSWLLLLSGWAQAIPFLTLLVVRNPSRAGAWMALGALIGLLSDLSGRVLATSVGNNQIATYLSSPLSAVCYCLALSELQGSPGATRAFRSLAVAFPIVWTILMTTVEDLRNFGLVTTPLYALTLLASGLWTLLHRYRLILEVRLTRTDWFWAGLGLALQGAAMALAASVGAIFVARGRLDLFNLVWHTRAVIMICSYLLLAYGIYRGPMVSKFSTAA
jgi:hypothetical protein